MKRKFSKILGVGLTLALLASLLLTAAPVSADVSSASLSLSNTTISTPSDYTVTFAVNKELGDHALEAGDPAGSNTSAGSATRVSSTTVLLSTGAPTTTETVDYARIVFPYKDTLSSITDLGYSYRLTAGNGAANWDSAPYMVIALDTTNSSTADTWVVHNMFALSPGLGTWLDWTLDMTMPRPMVTGNGTDMWFAAGTKTTSSPYLDWAAVKAVFDSDTVLEVKVAVGEWQSDIETAHEVKGCQINGEAVPGAIVIEFEEDFDLTGITGITVGASSGVGVTASAATSAVYDTNGQVLTIFVPNQIGAGATAQVVIDNVGNAAALGGYELKVSTSKETNAVPSATFTLIAPIISAVPGVVKGFNSAGVKLYEMTGGSAIQGAIGKTGVVTIDVGAGTYAENVTASVAGQTIKSTGGAAVTSINGTVTISQKVTFDGFTVEGSLQTLTTADATVTNCVLQGNPGVNVDVNTTLTTNTYEVGAAEVGVDVADAVTATISGGIFDIAATGTGIVNNGTLVLSGATLIGTSGVGIENDDTDEAATITSTTFSGLDTALDIDAGTVNIQTSTITGVGNATTPTPAISVATATLVIILNNTIADSVDEILNVAADEDNVFMNFNTITNPAKGITSTAASVDATNNLWDGGVAPPVTSTNATTSPYLVAAASNPSIVTGVDTLDAKATAGVSVTTTNAAAAIVVATYAANPSTAAVPGVASAYYDVYVSGTPGNTTIMLYGTVGAGTKAYVWGAGLGEWVPASDQAVNVFAGSVTVTVTASTIPSISDLVGLPFAIADPTPTTVIATAPEIVMPKAGAVDVVLRPTFDWLPVAGADGYYFQLADNPLFAPPLLISFEGDLGRLLAVQTAYTYVSGLDDYATAYHWRVKAVSGTIGAGDLLESAWVENVFITMDEPVEVLPPVVVEETPDVVLEPADIIVTLPPATPITPSWIYVIIAVGAVLVIALLVLIVRTRRVA